MAAGPRELDGSGPFRHGVASGDPRPDRVVIWTRVTTDAPEAGVRWTVATDPGLDEVVASGRTRTDGSRDFTVKIDVPGLSPACEYHYAFESEGHRSAVGRTRTAPAGHCERWRIAFTSCAKYASGFYNVYARMADRDDVDLVVHLGDYFYEYENDPGHDRGEELGRRYEPDHVLVTLDDYRDRYAQTHLDDACRRLHERHPWVCVFDDHEFANDRWREGASSHDPAVHGPWEERAAAALRAWYEWLPVRPPDPDIPERIYRRVPLADLADLLMLDCRSWRDEQAYPPELYAVDRELLGAQQHRWLTEQLDRSTATWRLVGNPIMVGQVYTQYLPEWLGEALAKLGILTEEEYGASPDQWDGYPAARDRLFAFVRDHGIRNLVFLSGDVHTAWAVHLQEDPTDEIVEPLAVEFVTASVTSENLDDEVGVEERRRGRDVEAHVMEDNPHVRWCELDDHGYVLLDVTHDRIRAEWWHVDTVLEPSDGETLKSAWEVREGHASLVHAGGEVTDRTPDVADTPADLRTEVEAAD